ncbi:MAG: cobalamin-dependent protein, partial [Deltaproteobacteria bacterium]|nr:cobalamin-dependent protein [Deltaproteobacteria bacterium]
MKISIAYPPLDRPGCPTLGQNRQFQWFSQPSFIYPMVPASAATILKRQGHEVMWDDAIARNKTSEEFWQHMETEKPDVIAIETKTPVVKDHWKIAGRIKDVLPDTSLVLMGDHVTALPEETMLSSPCDFVITGGDYDFSLRSIVQHLQNNEPLLPGIWYRENGTITNTGPYAPL